jgi:hypothetical protein
MTYCAALLKALHLQKDLFGTPAAPLPAGAHAAQRRLHLDLDLIDMRDDPIRALLAHIAHRDIAT